MYLKYGQVVIIVWLTFMIRITEFDFLEKYNKE